MSDNFDVRSNLLNRIYFEVRLHPIIYFQIQTIFKEQNPKNFKSNLRTSQELMFKSKELFIS